MKKGKSSLFIAYFLTILSVLAGLMGANRAITVISEGLPLGYRHCIIIDAGHGGLDGGATSCTGKLESGINLEIALRLEQMCHFLGYDTKMIRTEDISVYTKGETIAQKKVSDLKERVRICNETENGVLLSIHQNNFTDSRYRGAQVFHTNTEESKELARQIQSGFQSIDSGRTRQVKPAEGIYLMEHIQCNGVLIECGFLSNPEEEAKLRSETYQKQLCAVIAATVSNFLDG